MATLHPFRAHRPLPDRADAVASPPYDVVSSAEARALGAGKPDSFLRVSRPEIDLDSTVDEHAPEVHDRGALNLAELIQRGVLVQDPVPHLYLYELRMGEHCQIGIVGCVTVEDYETDVIRKHEKTRPDKEDDRALHIERLEAHDEPVFLTYRADATIDAMVRDVMTTMAPVYDFVADDAVSHRLWVVDAARGAVLCRQFDRIEALYVADGHHRSAAAMRAHRRLAGKPGEHHLFLAVLFPHSQVRILPYNRLVRDAAGRSAEELLAALSGPLVLTPQERPTTPSAGEFGLYLAGRWYRAELRQPRPDAADVIGNLDASLCQDRVLGPVFGIVDPRRDKNIDFVGGIRGTDELARRVDAGDFQLAIHLHPTSVDELLAVSDAGLLMPPKSTWFEPKLRSGLFVHKF